MGNEPCTVPSEKGRRVATGFDSVVPSLPGPSRGGLSLSLLSGFELRVDGRPLRVPLSAQRVVAFLGLNPGRVSRIFVGGHLWTLAREERAAGALRTALWRLGRPASMFVRCEGQWLSLSPDVEVDVADAARIARQLLDGADAATCETAFTGLRGAGELLPDWYDDWVLIERERFRQLRLHALERLCLDFSGEGRYAEATEAGLAAVASEPLRESAHRALIEAHFAAGNPCEAVRQYEICRRLLRRDLDLAPSAVLEGLIGHRRRREMANRVTTR
jgi:DNA-binding SARP family transcriptional activator